MDYQITWVGCSPDNYEAGGAVDPKTGAKHTPIAIVNHIMEGTLDGTNSWFHNPKAQASTNFGVGKDGRIFQFVAIGDDRPFANGAYCKETWKNFIKRDDDSIVNANRYTISIEHEGHTGESFTEEMYQATLWLHKKLITEWNIPIDREHIIGHYQIDACTRPNCPGIGFPWDRLMTDLKAWKNGKVGVSMKFIETYPANTFATVVSTALNVRRLPDGEIVGKLVANDRVKVIGRTDTGWTKVDIGQSGIAYVWSEYLKVDVFVVPQPVPQPTPIVNNPIMGTSQVSLDQVVAFVQSKNSNFDYVIAQTFLEVGAKYGVRGDVALCQSLIETGWFKFDGGTAVTPDQHNYCGMGVTSKGLKGASFSTIRDGVTAQLQHLFAYASKLSIPDGETLVDPRFNLVNRGVAPGWEDLNNRWAMNNNYGQLILSIYNDMTNFVIPAPAPVEIPEPIETPIETPIDETWEIKEGKKAVDKLSAIGLILTPDEWKTETKLMGSMPAWAVMLLMARLAEKLNK